jgi:perosamine synthetase
MIPVNEPLLGDRELEYITDCVRTGWVSSGGHYLEEFEQGWASYCGRRYGIAVSNGTTALYLTVASLGLEPGDVLREPHIQVWAAQLSACLQ